MAASEDPIEVMVEIVGIDDCRISARDGTVTLGTFAKAFDAVSKTHSYSTPNLRKVTVSVKSPYLEFTDHP
ncbi:hypothetical protein U0070_027224 [Myodes glareolus]|uniref:Uncharacterized protein n=1 Tax=Myodes glareolus TaxID=447135 RepID=A0AAW0IA50_MYOGA